MWRKVGLGKLEATTQAARFDPWRDGSRVAEGTSTLPASRSCRGQRLNGKPRAWRRANPSWPLNRVSAWVRRDGGRAQARARFHAALWLGFLSLAVACGTSQGTPAPRASRGHLDLSGWDFHKGGLVSLRGEWSLYWNEFVSPSAVGPPSTPQAFIEVPGSWEDVDVDGNSTTGHGYATYRLRVALPADSPPLALKIIDIGTEFSLYVNGAAIRSAGTVGKSARVSRPAFFSGVVALPSSTQGELDIVLHVSNFHYRTGGLWEHIFLGLPADARKRHEFALSYVLFLTGSIGIIGLYHLGLFSLRRRDLSPLYFCVLCGSIVIRILTTEDRFLTLFLPILSWDWLLRAEYVSFLVATSAFGGFLKGIFPHRSPRWIPRAVHYPALVFVTGILLSSPRTFSTWVPALESYIVGCCFLGIYSLGRAVVERRAHAGAFLFGFLVVTATIFNDILVAEGLLATPFALVGAGLFFLILIQAYVLSSRSARSLASIEQLSQELEAYSETLEERVVERTNELAEANRKFERLAAIDGLTQIANRRQFDETLERAWASHRRRRAPLSLVMCDIDYFKQFNDCSGHLKGDDVLRAVARAIEGAVLRPTDTVARYGGEEFAVLLPDTTLEGALEVAERVRQVVGELHIRHGSSLAGLELSLSLGVAEVIPDPEAESDQLVGEADAALYRAKAEGRNRVVAADLLGLPQAT